MKINRLMVSFSQQMKNLKILMHKKKFFYNLVPEKKNAEETKKKKSVFEGIF